MEVNVVSTEKERDDAISVRKTVFVEEQKIPVEEEIDEFDATATHLVMYDDGNAVGAGRFRVLDGVGKVERICVLSSLRGQGGGKILMKKIEEVAIKQGVTLLKLNAQTHAIPFYEGIGYEIVSEEFLDAGIPHKTMKKKILALF